MVSFMVKLFESDFKIENFEDYRFIDYSPIFSKNFKAFLLMGDRFKKLEKKDIDFFLKSKKIEIENILSLNQIHSDILVEEKDGESGDAIITRKNKIAICVSVADCVPIIIEGENEIAAIHSGYKGTLLEIVKKVIKHIKKPQKILLGPSINGCCYEVKEERLFLFKEKFPESKGINGTKIDLKTIIIETLLRENLENLQVYSDKRCTYCFKNFFPSFRRDKEKAGRMILFAFRF